VAPLLAFAVLFPWSVAAAPLDLSGAERMAFERQPQIESQEARVRAARERAVSAGQLPDPQLTGGVTNLPANGDDRFSLSRDFMTMTGVGLAQEFPRAQKRRLRSATESLAADEMQARLVALERAIRRDTALAYLDLWLPEQSAVLVERMIAEARQERGAAEIAFRAGRAPQSDLLAAEVELELLEDRRRRLAQDAAQARERLARWTGEPVNGALDVSVPGLPEPPELAELLSALERHPEIEAAQLDIAAGENRVALARAEYRPDWRVELGYAWRPDFSEMATLQFGIDLPVFTGQRQDRDVAAAGEELAAATAMHDDHVRQLRADAAAAWRSWSDARQRLARYDAAILPAASARAEAALAAYRAGSTELAAVLDARKSALDVNLMRLELQVEILRRLAELRYLNS
jgi:outer membrane protein TolC